MRVYTPLPRYRCFTPYFSLSQDRIVNLFFKCKIQKNWCTVTVAPTISTTVGIHGLLSTRGETRCPGGSITKHVIVVHNTFWTSTMPRKVICKTIIHLPKPLFIHICYLALNIYCRFKTFNGYFSIFIDCCRGCYELNTSYLIILINLMTSKTVN